MDHPARRINDAERNALKNLLDGFEDLQKLSNELRHQSTVDNESK